MLLKERTDIKNIMENKSGSINSLSYSDDTLLEVQITEMPKDNLAIAVGIANVMDLLPHVEIDVRNHAEDKGYQRIPTSGRTGAIMEAVLKTQTNLPTAPLLNIREFDIQRNIIVSDNGRIFLRLESCDILWAVDGQTRLRGLQKVHEKDPKFLENYEIPVVIGLGWSVDQELEEFYRVNSNAKSVPVNLAYDLLRKLNKIDSSMAKMLEIKGESWKVWGQNVVERIVNECPEWKGKVKFANEKGKGFTIPASGFVASLKPIWDSDFFKDQEEDDQIAMLCAFWCGVKMVLPEVFDAPSDYLVQKRIGTSVLHGVFPRVMQVIINKGKDVRVAVNYADVLREPLSVDDGTIVDRLLDYNSELDEVSGHYFWRSGPAGAAAKFSSGTGVRTLITRLQNILPRLRISS